MFLQHRRNVDIKLDNWTKFDMVANPWLDDYSMQGVNFTLRDVDNNTLFEHPFVLRVGACDSNVVH